MESLTVRAPRAGQLTGLDAEIGQSIQRGDRLGQIDDASAFKVTTFVDEFYLPRLDNDQEATFTHRDRDYAMRVQRIFPQVRNGQFEGDFVAIMGPSGCGKSTLLNIIGLLDNPTSGSYRFLGQDVAKFSERRLAEARKGYIGFIFQSFNLIDELTVRENVELALLYQGVAPGQRRKLVKEALEKMNIAHRAKHMPQQLSGGQQQRVAVARAVVGNPKMILADEPTGSLDTKNGEEVMQMLTDLNRCQRCGIGYCLGHDLASCSAGGDDPARNCHSLRIGGALGV